MCRTFHGPCIEMCDMCHSVADVQTVPCTQCASSLQLCPQCRNGSILRRIDICFLHTPLSRCDMCRSPSSDLAVTCTSCASQLQLCPNCRDPESGRCFLHRPGESAPCSTCGKVCEVHEHADCASTGAKHRYCADCMDWVCTEDNMCSCCTGVRELREHPKCSRAYDKHHYCFLCMDSVCFMDNNGC